MGENLPVLHESEEPSSIERLRMEMARRDGFLSPSNAVVPLEASDVGDVPIKPNPKPRDLEQFHGSVDEVVEHEGMTYLADGRMGPTAEIGIDSDCFIEDVTEWA